MILKLEKVPYKDFRKFYTDYLLFKENEYSKKYNPSGFSLADVFYQSPPRDYTIGAVQLICINLHRININFSTTLMQENGEFVPTSVDLVLEYYKGVDETQEGIFSNTLTVTTGVTKNG